MRHRGVPAAEERPARVRLVEQEQPHRGAPGTPAAQEVLGRPPQEEETPATAATAPARGRRGRDRRDRIAAVVGRPRLGLQARFGELPRFGTGVLQLFDRFDGVGCPAAGGGQSGGGEQHRGSHRQAQDHDNAVQRGRLNCDVITTMTGVIVTSQDAFEVNALKFGVSENK